MVHAVLAAVALGKLGGTLVPLLRAVLWMLLTLAAIRVILSGFERGLLSGLWHALLMVMAWFMVVKLLNWMIPGFM